MTHNIYFAKLVVQEKDSKKIQSVFDFVYIEKLFIIVGSSPTWTIFFIEEGIYCMFSQSFPLYFAFQLSLFSS